MNKYFWFISLWLILSSCEKSVNVELSKDFRIIAHRGGTSVFPENSLGAIAHAMELGVDAIEMDIRLTKDSVIVVCHDDSIDRVSTGTGKLKDMTYDQIRTYQLKFNGTPTDQHIPTLEEVLRLVDKKVELYIEIKEGSVEIEQRLLTLLGQYDYSSAVSVISFDYRSLVRISRKNPNIKLQFLLYNTSDTLVLLRSTFESMRGMILDHWIVNKGVVDKIRSIDKTLEVYTVDDIEAIPEEMYDWIDGLISNSPEYWMRIRQK